MFNLITGWARTPPSWERTDKTKGGERTDAVRSVQEVERLPPPAAAGGGSAKPTQDSMIHEACAGMHPYGGFVQRLLVGM